MPVLWWIFGAAFTRLLRVLLDVGGIVPSPPGLIYLVALLPGLPRLRSVIYSRVPSLIIVPLFFVLPSPKLFVMVLVVGN